MSRRRPGWRAAARTFRHLSRALARRAAESVQLERESLAAQVCPDGPACSNPRCTQARAAILRGAGWRQAHAIIYGGAV